LAQQAGQPVATVLAGARVHQPIGSRVCQAQRVIQLAVSQQPGIRSGRGTKKLQQQTMVETEPQSAFARFTRRRLISIPRKLLNLNPEPSQMRSKLPRHLANAG
jgi:hypothetical protein